MLWYQSFWNIRNRLLSEIECFIWNSRIFQQFGRWVWKYTKKVWVKFILLLGSFGDIFNSSERSWFIITPAMKNQNIQTKRRGINAETVILDAFNCNFNSERWIGCIERYSFTNFSWTYTYIRNWYGMESLTSYIFKYWKWRLYGNMHVNKNSWKRYHKEFIKHESERFNFHHGAESLLNFHQIKQWRLHSLLCIGYFLCLDSVLGIMGQHLYFNILMCREILLRFNIDWYSGGVF